MTREAANLEILALLSLVVMKHPDLRFIQLLSLFTMDQSSFYEESEVTLQKLKNLLDSVK